MKIRMMLLTAALTAAVFVVPAYALEYTIDSPNAGEFGTPTSDETVYVGAEATVNVDRSKNAALIPPGFGTPTSNLPGSGEPLTPNLAPGDGAVTVTNPSTGGGTVSVPNTGAGSVTEAPGVSYPVTAYTAVTSDLYYSGDYLGRLKIPALDLNVKLYQGTSDTQLAKGAGHFPGTSIWDGNVAIAGHNRGVNCYFGNIHTLDTGDKITLTTKLGTRTYAVTGVYKISETDRSMLSATAENCITLYTCVRNESAYRWCVLATEI